MKFSYKNILIWLILAFLVMVFVAIFLAQTNIFELKTSSYNFMARINANKQAPSDKILLVVIDDKSLADLGRWPWKRSNFNEIFEYINNHTKAKLIAFDAIVASSNPEEEKDDAELFKNIGKYNKLTVGVAFNDKDFSLSEEEKKIYNQMFIQKNVIKIEDKRSKKLEAPYKSFTQFPFEYFKNTKTMGSVNVVKDSDGYIRQIQQVIDYKNNLYPSLELVLFSKYSGITNFILDDKYLKGENENYALKIPVENNGGETSSNIYFYRSQDKTYSHQLVSASDVINSLRAIKKGKKPVLDSAIFRDKIVFVGANANAQYARDEVRTPISDSFAGIEIRATNFNNMLKNEFYITTNLVYDLLAGITIFALIFILICLLPIPAALLTTFTIVLLYFIFSAFMYSKNVAINIFLPVIFVPIALIVGYSYKFLLEGKKKEQIEKAMGKYISKDVMKDVIQNIDSIGLGGKRANITVLFADIRGFTSISEMLSAEEVSMILNEYFSAIVPIIESNNGVLNKFVGDAVLVIFGEPIKNEYHALDAVKCAWGMLEKVKELQTKWLEDGKPKIEIGIGISTGEAFVGNIGSEERLEYTVIGDTVNTASRIENFNKVYKTKFLISQSTFDVVQKHVDVIKIREVTIRGKVKKVNIYEVLRLIG